MKDRLSAGVVALGALALLLPALGPCLCTAAATTTGSSHECCPSPGASQPALSNGQCCAAPEARPASAAEATLRFPTPFVVVATWPAAGDEGLSLVAHRLPAVVTHPFSVRPLPNLRI